MSRHFVLYFDESVIPDRGLLVGSLVREGPLPAGGDAWLDLVRNPHAAHRDRAAGLEGPALRHLRAGGFGRLWVHLRDLAHERRKEHAYLDLLVHVLLALDLGPDDTLTLHPERFDAGGGERTTGKFEGLVTGLRWILPHLPRDITVQSFPSDVHVLVGHSAVDLALLDLSRRVRGGATLAAAAGDHRALTALEVPELTDLPDTLTWLRARLGLEVDPIALARLTPAPGPVVPGDPKGWLDRLAPFAENPGLALRDGLDPARVSALLDALPEPADPDLSLRLLRLRARARTHLGRPREAIEVWNLWGERIESLPLDRPERLIEDIQGRLAVGVLLTDLRDTEGALQELDEAERTLSRRWSFERDPLMGRLLGARAQARLLGGDPDVLALLERSLAFFDHPAERSYGWTWSLVALGRGAPCPDPTGLAERIVAEAMAAEGLDQAGLLERRPFLRWGLAEALARQDLRAGWARAGALEAALNAFADRRSNERSPALGHPDRLTVRAVVLRRPRLGGWSPWEGAPVTAEALALPDAAQLSVLRSVAAAAAHPDADPAWLARARSAVAAARVQVAPIEDFRALGQTFDAFLAIDPAAPAAGAAAYLALGGY